MQRQPLPPAPTFASLRPSQRVACVVSEAADDHAWLSVAAGVRGRLHALDSSPHPAHVAKFTSRIKVQCVGGGPWLWVFD